jgi:dTDP-4-amino-4,6-dideoxygalactose transaminase
MDQGMQEANPSQPTILANDFKAQWKEISADAMAAVQRVGESGWYILGSEVKAFESALAQATGFAHAVGCGNGMDAIEIALRAGGLQQGERVVTTPLSAFATTLAILRAGGVPHFIDVDENGLLDLDLVREELATQQPFRWLVPVHLYGQCMNLKKLADLRDDYGLQIVEDGAQSIGASWAGQSWGTVGIAASTSFYPTKNLGAMGDGGALLTHDGQLAEACKTWRDYGQAEKYVHAVPGLNSRLDELQAAILHDAMLPRLARYTEARTEMANFYRTHLEKSHLRLLPEHPAMKSVHHLFPVFVEQNRQGFMDHLKSHGIVSGIHYPKLIPDQPAMFGQNYTLANSLPRARAIAAQAVSLPIHPYLTSADLARVVAACSSWKVL